MHWKEIVRLGESVGQVGICIIKDDKQRVYEIWLTKLIENSLTCNICIYHSDWYVQVIDHVDST